MADDLRRFVTDLRALRESRGVSLQRIQGDTRIPLDVLRQFEENGLEGNRTYNRVYLRSLVRVYSQSIGVAVDPVLHGLDSAFEGQYGGIGADAPPAAPAPASPPPSEPAALESAPLEPAPDTPPAAAPDDRPPAEEDAPPVAYEPEGRRVVELPQSYDGAPVFDTVPERPGLPSWAYALLVLVALGAVAAGVVWWMGRTPAPSLADNPAVVEDTTGGASDSAAAAPALPTTLPDTLRLTIRATGGALSPVKITLDQDVRRPFWIEADSSEAFSFRDSVVVEDVRVLSELSVEGVKVAETLRQPDGSYRIRRADLQR